MNASMIRWKFLTLQHNIHRMKRIIFIFPVLALMIKVSPGQHLNVLISESDSPNEPSIIINPKNTSQLYAGANLNNVYFSGDGGYSWEEGKMYSSVHGVWGDPVLMCDTAGAFYYFHLSNPTEGSWIDRIVCQKAETFGGAWNDGSAMGLNGTKDQDKEWAVVDRSNNHIYVTWTQFDAYGTSNPDYFSNIMFSRSFDGGVTWSPAIQINEVSGDCIDSDNTTEGAVPCVGPNGEIYVSWAGPAGLVFDRSLDMGTTWLENDIFISEIGDGWDYSIPGIYRANGLPVTLCDTSGGPYHGNIYVNWSDQANGSDDTDIWLVKSQDGGNTWTEPIRVNDDPPGKQQFFTWMAIDQTNGHLYFVFYDRRNYDDTRTDVFVAMSADGGESFVNFPVSESPFIPYSSIFFGDYTNITAHDDVIRPIWARLDGYQIGIWTAIVDPGAVGLVDREVDMSCQQTAYPNPFRETTFFSFKLHQPAPVRLTVCDNLGKTVAGLVDVREMAAGKYTYELDAEKFALGPGTYYFSLVTGSVTHKQKIILAR